MAAVSTSKTSKQELLSTTSSFRLASSNELTIHPFPIARSSFQQGIFATVPRCPSATAPQCHCYPPWLQEWTSRGTLLVAGCMMCCLKLVLWLALTFTQWRCVHTVLKHAMREPIVATGCIRTQYIQSQMCELGFCRMWWATFSIGGKVDCSWAATMLTLPGELGRVPCPVSGIWFAKFRNPANWNKRRVSHPLCYLTIIASQDGTTPKFHLTNQIIRGACYKIL